MSSLEKCPVCFAGVPKEFIGSHVDACLSRVDKDTVLKHEVVAQVFSPSSRPRQIGSFAAPAATTQPSWRFTVVDGKPVMVKVEPEPHKGGGISTKELLLQQVKTPKNKRRAAITGSLDQDGIEAADEVFARELARAEARALENEEDENERLFEEFFEAERRQRISDLDRLLYACPTCAKEFSIENMFTLDNCNHRFCRECFHRHILESIKTGSSRTIECNECAAAVSHRDVKLILLDEEYDSYMAATLAELIESSEDIVRCPRCDFAMEKIHGFADSKGPTPTVLDSEGKRVSDEAAKHRELHRLRCPECSEDFCCGCRAQPYHLGRTCEQHIEYLQSRHCRFCACQLTERNVAKAPRGVPATLRDVCNLEECVAKRDMSCEETLGCGHLCGGIRGEKAIGCLPCLSPQCLQESNEADHNSDQSCDDFCSICYVEALGAGPCIQLQCGHVFHYQCVVDHVKQRWAGARITFGFTLCPLCKVTMHHWSLEREMEEILLLKQKVEQKAQNRLVHEGLQNDAVLCQRGSKYYQDALAYAMDVFAYYPCYNCGQPYFGGARRCDEAANDPDRVYDPKELVCGGCSRVAGQEDCPTHGADFMEYKCRFCCNVATWFCWGNTHFCADCHRRQSNGEYLNKKPKSSLPKCPGPKKCKLHIKHPPQR